MYSQENMSPDFSATFKCIVWEDYFTLPNISTSNCKFEFIIVLICVSQSNSKVKYAATHVPHFLRLCRYWFFFFSASCAAILLWASLSRSFFQQHMLTFLLCRILVIRSRFQFFIIVVTAVVSSNQWSLMLLQELFWGCPKRLWIKEDSDLNWLMCLIWLTTGQSILHLSPLLGFLCPEIQQY